MNIETIIDNLLKEPIAHVLCDSGRPYGYRYEKNREEGYLKGLNPVDAYTNEDTKERTLEITIPVYDFLTYNLEKDTEIEADILSDLETLGINPYDIYDVEEFLKNGKAGNHYISSTGIYDINYINTYNGEEFLSQTLLWCPFKVDDEDDYIFLEVHNGADVRSGYTKPQIFRVKDIEYWGLGQSDRKCECDCGLNDYTIYGSDTPTDSTGTYIYEDEIYERTYIDNEGKVRCKDCNSIIKGGFVKW